MAQVSKGKGQPTMAKGDDFYKGGGKGHPAMAKGGDFYKGGGKGHPTTAKGEDLYNCMYIGCNFQDSFANVERHEAICPLRHMVQARPDSKVVSAGRIAL